MDTWTRSVVPEENAQVLRLLPSIRMGGTVFQMFSFMGPIMLDGCSAESGSKDFLGASALMLWCVNVLQVELWNALLLSRRKVASTTGRFFMVDDDDDDVNKVS